MARIGDVKRAICVAVERSGLAQAIVDTVAVEEASPFACEGRDGARFGIDTPDAVVLAVCDVEVIVGIV